MKVSLLARALVAALAVSCFAPAAFAQEKKAPNPEKVFAKKDADGDGKLSLEEFKAGMKEEQAAKAGARFNKLDKDGDGTLSLEEFSDGMKAGPAKKKKKGA
jgi:Ca2+-binding EF-hand superfamily protein